jgi:hypothetical protein
MEILRLKNIYLSPCFRMSTNFDTSLIREYNDAVDIIIILILLVPLMIIFFFIIAYFNDRRVYQVSVSQHKDFPEESDLTKLSAKLGGIDERCKNNIRWVYSHKFLEPIYGVCDIKTLEDCYRWLVCKRPDICPYLEQSDIDCSKLYCRTY